MKQKFYILILLLGVTYCKAQQVNGVWMSYNNYVIDINSAFQSGDEGLIIDFNDKTFQFIYSDSIIPIDIDYDKNIISFNDSLKIEFQTYLSDSITMDIGTNMMHVFRPLDLKNSLKLQKNQIKEFLTKNNFDKINGEIEVEFKDEPFFRDVMFEEKFKRNALNNKSWDDEGYWFAKEIKHNYFLIFALDQTADQNIYQIESLDDCSMKLIQLQKATFGEANISELRKCDK